MIGLDIQMMQAGEHKLLIQLDMEDLSSERTVTTFGFIKPKGDIHTQLRQHIDNDIETLYEIISQQRKKHTVCVTVCVTTNLQQGENQFETAPQ